MAAHKMRSANNNNSGTTSRNRPKTIDIDAVTDLCGEVTGSGSSRGKLGSSNNHGGESREW